MDDIFEREIKPFYIQAIDGPINFIDCCEGLSTEDKSYIATIYGMRVERTIYAIYTKHRRFDDACADDIRNFLNNNPEEGIKTCIPKITNNYKKLKELIRNIKSKKAVFVIGAGVSFEADVNPLLIEGVVYQILKNKFKKDETNFINKWEDKEKQKSLWIKHLHKQKTRKKFQEDLISVLSNTEPAASHKYIASLFLDTKKILCLICLNWDELIENVDKDNFRKKIEKVVKRDMLSSERDFMWKPHGCASRPDKEWILPYEGIRLTNFNKSVKQKMNEINGDGNPYVLVTIGYSGEDKVINTQFCKYFFNDPPRQYCIGREPLKTLPKSEFIELDASEALLIMERMLIKSSGKRPMH
jgi:hypothetical protein